MLCSSGLPVNRLTFLSLKMLTISQAWPCLLLQTTMDLSPFGCSIGFICIRLMPSTIPCGRKCNSSDGKASYAGSPIASTPAHSNSNRWASSFPSTPEMSRTASYTGTSTAVAAAEVTEQHQVLRQLQTSMQELHTSYQADQRQLGSASSALQVCTSPVILQGGLCTLTSGVCQCDVSRATSAG